MTNCRSSERGVTLIEMVVVTLLVALMAALSFPAVSSGIDTLRVSGAARDIASFFNSGLNRAQRRQQAVEVVVSQKDNRLWMISVEPGFRRELRLPDTVVIQAIFPELEQLPDQPRSFLLYPGGSTPAMGVMLKGNHGAMRTVRVDPVTGVPSVTIPES